MAKVLLLVVGWSKDSKHCIAKFANGPLVGHLKALDQCYWGLSINVIRFFGIVFDPRPPLSDFPHILKAFLHRDSDF